MDDLKARLAEYRERGFTVFERVFTDSQMAAWRDAYPELVKRATLPGASQPKLWLGSAVELAPDLFLPAVAHPTLLDFAEAVMGPFVQLDNLTFTAFPSMPADQARGKVSGWHRDIWAEMPRTKDYARPLACNAISYLQDLDDAIGPLRVVPGSHRQAIGVDAAQVRLPRSDEQLVYAKAGDVVFTHNGLLHSGTPNTSGKPRFFFSIYYNLSWLRHRDNHSGPNVQAIVAQARQHGDRRLMRLLGVDEHAFARANSGFLVPDEERWEAWRAEDRAARQEPGSGNLA